MRFFERLSEMASKYNFDAFLIHWFGKISIKSSKFSKMALLRRFGRFTTEIRKPCNNFKIIITCLLFEPQVYILCFLSLLQKLIKWMKKFISRLKAQANLIFFQCHEVLRQYYSVAQTRLIISARDRWAEFRSLLDSDLKKSYFKKLEK